MALSETKKEKNPQGDLVRWRQVYTYNDLYYRHDDTFATTSCQACPSTSTRVSCNTKTTAAGTQASTYISLAYGRGLCQYPVCAVVHHLAGEPEI